jgi:phosphatidate cytidylyltransferase
MTKRVLTALVAGSLAVAAVLLLPAPIVFWVVLALLVGCAFEYTALCRRLVPDFPRALLVIAVPLVALAWLRPASSSPPGVPFMILGLTPLVFAVLLLAAPTPKSGATSLAWASFGLPYLVLPVWAIYELHRLHPRLLLVFLVSVWVNDSAALLTGSLIGRHKLAPRLSPNKTWEGSIGGFLGAAAVAWGGLAWLGVEHPRWKLLAVFLVAAVAAQLGDLVESMLKRAAEVKDSGHLVPGHGGLLDRLDAIILAGPVFYGLLEATGLAAGL